VIFAHRPTPSGNSVAFFLLDDGSFILNMGSSECGRMDGVWTGKYRLHTDTLYLNWTDDKAPGVALGKAWVTEKYVHFDGCLGSLTIDPEDDYR
jgi:hypothetical protein